MAINPNLVSIVPASELPTGTPTSAGQFFFYEGNEMKKSPMSEIYGLITNSKSIGTITTSSTIPAEGNVWGFAGEGTYNNAGNITVAAGKFAILSRVGTTWSKVEVDLSNFTASDNLIALAKKINGYYIDHSNGNLIGASTHTITDYIQLSPDTIYEYGNYFDNSNFAFYDKDKNFIPNDSSIVRIFGFKTPENAKYIRLSYLTANEKNVFFVSKEIEASNKWENLIKTISSGYYIDHNSGGVQPASGFSFTNFIKIKPNRWFKINPNSYQQFAFYDENLQYISDDSSKNNLKAFKSPSNAEYIRMTVNDNEVNSNYLIMLSEEIEDNIIRVSKKYGDFDKINDAVQFAHSFWPRRFTIKIANGVYEEEIIANQGIGHSLIADSKYEVIVCDVNDTDKKWETLKVKSGYYFEGIYFKRNGGGYAVHADYGGTDADTEFFNCKIESLYGSAIGYGQQQNQSVKFRNCQIIQRSGLGDTGIVYLHNAVNKDVTGGNIELWNCEVYGFDKVIRIDDSNQIYGDGLGALGRFKPLFVGNNFKSINYTTELDLRNGNATTASGAIIGNIVIDERSHGNNIASLNHDIYYMMQGKAYGVRIDNSVSNPALTRIGDMTLHRNLPIQSLMRRCLLKADGTVNYYLDANNSTLKENGTAANLTGMDGDVMVEIPQFYFRVDVISATASELWISQTNLPGFQLSEKCYISAYQATVDRTVPATLKLASVVNTTANFRGGNNNAAWDAESRTLLGRPASLISRTNARNYARNKGAAGKNGAGWNQLTYNAYKSLFWLYFVEYANKNSQATFNSALDANGFRQGGLGAGVTDLNVTKWSTFNSYYPFVPMGFSNSLGNKTGVLPFTMPTEYDSVPFTTYVPSYRGVENPFGHIWQWVDGINVKTQAADAGGRTVYFATDNPSLFQDSNYTGFREVGDSPRANGYVKSLILGQFADFLAKENVGAGNTTYWTDSYDQNIPSTGEVLRGLLVGGSAADGASAGLAYSSTHLAPSYTSATIGLRLCYLP